MTRQLQVILSELRGDLEKLYGDRLSRVILYRSQARRDAEESSDIDILVVLSDDVNAGAEIARTSKAVSQLSLKYNTLVSCAFVSEDRFAKEQSPLLVNIRREGIAA